jgi:membrane associated rhomboid family serine protease
MTCDVRVVRDRCAGASGVASAGRSAAGFGFEGGPGPGGLRLHPTQPDGAAPQQQQPPREPLLNAPWPLLAIAAVILGGYALQSLGGHPDAAMRAFGFSPADLREGRWSGLVTALFIHGGWAHAGLNALGALAFGAPVIRLFGLSARGVIGFFVFYMVCGVLGSLGFALVRWGSPDVLIGASGAISGLMGAASRLADRGPGLADFFSRTVIGMAVGWVVVNLLIAFTGLDVGQGGQPVAWEAHLFGYAAGLLLIGPLAAMAGVLPRASA